MYVYQIQPFENCYTTDRGVTTGGKGHNFPGVESLWAPNHCRGRRKVPTMSEVPSSIHRAGESHSSVPS